MKLTLPELEPSTLTDTQLIVVNREADVLRRKILDWRVDKNDDLSPKIKANSSLQKILVHAYYTLMFAIKAAHDGLVSGSLTEIEWKKAQAGVVSQIMDWINASEEVTKLQADTNTDKGIALNLAGLIIRHSAEVADSLQLDTNVHQELFGIDCAKVVLS